MEIGITETIFDGITLTVIDFNKFLFQQNDCELILLDDNGPKIKKMNFNGMYMTHEQELFVTICLSYVFAHIHQSFEDWKMEIVEFYKKSILEKPQALKTY